MANIFTITKDFSGFPIAWLFEHHFYLNENFIYKFRRNIQKKSIFLGIVANNFQELF